MSYSAPDTNILIFEIVGGNSDQVEDAGDYFDLIKADDRTGLVLEEVDREFKRVIQKRISELRPYALKAKKHSSWEKAEDFTPDNEYADNFAEALRERCSPENGLSKLSRWKRSIFASFQRLKNKMKIDDERDLNPEKVSEIKDEIPDKNNHEPEEEKKTDARIIYSTFLCSKEYRKNTTLVSDDYHILETDFTEIEEILDFDDSTEIVSSNTPSGYAESVA